jgi:hypothetical protein
VKTHQCGALRGFCARARMETGTSAPREPSGATSPASEGMWCHLVVGMGTVGLA